MDPSTHLLQDVLVYCLPAQQKYVVNRRSSVLLSLLNFTPLNPDKVPAPARKIVTAHARALDLHFISEIMRHLYAAVSLLQRGESWISLEAVADRDNET